MPELQTLPVKKQLEVSIGAIPFGDSRRTVMVEAGQTVSAILGDIPPCERHEIIVISQDRVIECEEWYEVIPSADYPLYVNVVPSDDFLPILAVIALSVFAPYAGAAAASALGLGAVGAAVITGVITVAGGVLINNIFGQSDSGRGRDPQRFGLQGTQNTLPTHQTPVLCVMGTHRVVPYLACKPYSYVIDTKNKGFRALYDFGYGPLEFNMDSFKFGESAVSSFENVVVQMNDGSGNANSAVAGFPVIHDQIELNKELLPYEENTFDYGPGVVRLVLAIEFPIFIKFSKKGKQKTAHCDIQFALKREGEAGFTVLSTRRFQGRSTSNLAFEESITVARRAAAAMGGQIRVTRLTVDDDAGSDAARLQNNSFLTTLDKVTTVAPVQTPGRALVFVQVRASQELQGSLQTFSAVVTRKIPSYNGTRWSAPRTANASNPAWQFASVLRGPGIRKPVANSLIDAATLQAFAARCTTREYRFDAVLNNVSGVWERLGQVCAIGRATPDLIDSRMYTVVMDRKQTVPVDLITPRDSLGFVGVKQWEPRPDAFRVSYNDRDNAYLDTQVVIYDDGVTEATASDVRALQLASYGITHVDEAHKFVRYILADAKLRPESFMVRQDVKALRLRRGDYVDLVHDIALIGLGTGRVVSASGNAFSLDENIALTGGSGYTARFQNFDGSALVGGVRASSMTDAAPTGAVLLRGAATEEDTSLTVDGAGAEDVITGLRFTIGSDTVVYTVSSVVVNDSDSADVFATLTISPALTQDFVDNSSITFEAVSTGGSYLFLGSGSPTVGTVCSLGVSGQEKLECLVRSIRAFDDLSAEVTLVPLANAVHDAEEGTVPDYNPMIGTGTASEFGAGETRTVTSRVDNGNGTQTINYSDATSQTVDISVITTTGGGNFAFFRRTVADGTSTVVAVRGQFQESIQWLKGTHVVATAVFDWTLNDDNQLVVENQMLSAGVTVASQDPVTANPRERELRYMDEDVESTAEYDATLEGPSNEEHEELQTSLLNRITQLEALFPSPSAMLAGRVLVIGQTTYEAAELEVDLSPVTGTLTISPDGAQSAHRHSITDGANRTGTSGAEADHDHSRSSVALTGMPDVNIAAGAVPGRVVAEKPTVRFVSQTSTAALAGTALTHTVTVEKTVFAAMPAPVTVRYSIGGSATSGTDFTTLSGTVRIPAGDTSADIDIVFAATADSAETVILTITANNAYNIATPNNVHTVTTEGSTTSNADYTDGEIFLIDSSGTERVVRLGGGATTSVVNTANGNGHVTALSLRRGTGNLLSADWNDEGFYEYDGSSWTFVGSGTGSAAVQDLGIIGIAAHPSDFSNTYGADYVDGDGDLFRYDGNVWSTWIDVPAGTSLLDNNDECPIAFDANGDLLYVRKRDSDGRTYIYKYTVASSTWSAFLNTPNGIHNNSDSQNIDIAVNWTNGHIYLSRETGYFVYNGTSWSGRQAAPTGVRIHGIAIFNTLATS